MLRKFHIKKYALVRIITAGSMMLMFLAGSFTACEPEDWLLGVSCDECFNHRPDSADLIVHLTINELYDSVPLTFYIGDSEGEVDWKDTATGSEFRLYSEVGITYTVMAEYRSEGGTILAFDQDEMILKDYGNECGDPCYIIKGGIFDLRIPE